jgi:hypothetical protein
MKSRPSPRRKPPSRDLMPPDVPEVANPEVASAASPAAKDESGLLPDHIRRMLEAAYT